MKALIARCVLGTSVLWVTALWVWLNNVVQLDSSIFIIPFSLLMSAIWLCSLVVTFVTVVASIEALNKD